MASRCIGYLCAWGEVGGRPQSIVNETVEDGLHRALNAVCTNAPMIQGWSLDGMALNSDVSIVRELWRTFVC